MFETVVPRDRLEDVLRLEALRFGLDRTAWTEDLVPTERQIIAQEVRDRGAQRWMVDAVRDQLFPAPHPYGVVGSVTVASAPLAFCMRRSASGFPTIILRPRMTTCVPVMSILLSTSNRWTPSGVHGTKPVGSPSASFATFSG